MDNSKPVVVVAIVGIVPVTICNTAVVSIVVPGTAAQNTGSSPQLPLIFLKFNLRKYRSS